MKNDRRARLGLGAITFVATAIFASLAAPPTSADARGHRVAQVQTTPNGTATGFPPTPQPAASGSPIAVPGTPVPGPALNGGQPTPFPLNTLAPLTGETSLPYPAYGTPVPGINAGSPAPGISAILPLQQSILIGFARSPLLAIAREDVNVAAAEVRLQRAGLLPSVAASAAYEYDHSQPGTSSFAGSAAAGLTQRSIDNNASFGLSISQLIYDGGKLADGVRAAGTQQRATADNYRRELETVAYNVATAYYNYLAAERLTQVDLEIVREDAVQVSLVQAQVRAGTAARSDVATVQLPLAQARLAVVKAQGAELSAEAAFANSMGLDANVKIQPVDDSPVFTSAQVSTIPLPTYDVALKRALALRPDYDSAEQSVAQEQFSLSEAKLGLFPTLAASANATDDSSDGRAGTFRNAQTLGVSLSIPLYDQGQTAANTASAKANLNIAYADLKNTELTVELNVKQALTNLVSSRAALDQTKQEYETALINVQATQAQYRAGVTTLPLLLNAQVQLTQALVDQVTAVYTLRQAEQTYLYAVGSNYDTSADNGKSTITPLPGPEAQGGKLASAAGKPRAKPKKTAAHGGTVFAR